MVVVVVVVLVMVMMISNSSRDATNDATEGTINIYHVLCSLLILEKCDLILDLIELHESLTSARKRPSSPYIVKGECHQIHVLGKKGRILMCLSM